MNQPVLATRLALATALPAIAQDNPTAKAEFVNLAGAKIGTAILTETSQYLRGSGANTEVAEHHL